MKLFYKKPDLAQQSKNQYWLHPELAHYIKNGFGMTIRNKTATFWALLFVIVGIWLGFKLNGVLMSTLTYFITLTLWIFSFWVVIKPLMLKGKIKGYYRRSYSDNNLFTFFLQIKIFFSVLFGGGIILYQIIAIMMTVDDSVDLKYQLDRGLTLLTNPFPFALATGVFFFLVYYFFYREQYISIEEYSHRITNIIRERGCNLYTANRILLYQRDGELGREIVNEVKYNETINHPVQEQKTVVQRETVQRPITTPTAPDSTGQEQVPIRRKSRR